MSCRLLTAFLLFSLSCFLSDPLGATEQVLKVITFNTYLLCVGPKCLLREVPEVEKRTDQIAAWLKGQNADLIFLQEVWQEEQFEIIKKEAGYPYAVYFGKKSDLAILSRHPLSSPRYLPTHWQGSHSEDCKKGIVGYRYGLGLVTANVDGTEILLAHTHPIARRSAIEGFELPSDAITPERLTLQLEFWNELKDKLNTQPLIFAGDFNMNPDSVEYAFFNRLFGLTDSLKKIMGEPRRLCSYCGSNYWAKEQGSPAEGVIDYIFVNEFFDVIDAKIDFPKPDLSDHQPVEAILKLKETDRRGNPPWLPILGRPQGAAPTKNEIDRLIDYIKKVSLSPYCYLSYEMGWGQRKRTTEFLKKTKSRHPNPNHD